MDFADSFDASYQDADSYDSDADGSINSAENYDVGTSSGSEASFSSDSSYEALIYDPLRPPSSRKSSSNQAPAAEKAPTASSKASPISMPRKARSANKKKKTNGRKTNGRKTHGRKKAGKKANKKVGKGVKKDLKLIKKQLVSANRVIKNLSKKK
jgi:hypothetical protein